MSCFIKGFSLKTDVDRSVKYIKVYLYLAWPYIRILSYDVLELPKYKVDRRKHKFTE